MIKLPKPVETCINKQVLLPRLECDQVIYLTCSVFFQFLILCHQVHERRCMLAPRTQPGPTIKLDKCSVVVGEPACSDTVLQLPRQVCTWRWRGRCQFWLISYSGMFTKDYQAEDHLWGGGARVLLWIGEGHLPLSRAGVCPSMEDLAIRDITVIILVLSI